MNDLQSSRSQQVKLQQQLHAAFAAADLQASKIATLEEQLHTHTSDANDLLSVMNGMREALAQQQGAISKLAAKRSRAEERAVMAEARRQQADAAVEQQAQRVLELQAQLKDATISIQLHQAVSERFSKETCSAQVAHEQKINDMKDSLQSQLQQAETTAKLSQERMRDELDALRAAHILQLQQLQTTHDCDMRKLQADLEQAQHINMQLTHDVDHAQADAIDLLQKCDVLRQSISEDAQTYRSKLSLASAAASQSHSNMVAAQEACSISEAAVTALDSENKLLRCQVQQFSDSVASLRAELDLEQQCTADATSSARAAGIAQQIAESELQLEKEATLLHRSRADTAEKALEESNRMRADVQVVFAAASDELADALETLRDDDGDTSAAYSACNACLQMLRHTRPVLVDPGRHDAAILALQDICAASASQAGRKVASMAVAVADAMREADELRSRCCDQEKQLQALHAESAQAAAFCEQLQQMHARIDAMTEALEEEHRRHQSLVEENKRLEFVCSQAAAEALGARQQSAADASELQHLQRALHDLHHSSASAEAISKQEVSRLTAAVAATNLNYQKLEADAVAARMQLAVFETKCSELQAELDRSIQKALQASVAAESAAAVASNLQQQCNSLQSDSKGLATEVETWRLAAQAAELRLNEVEEASHMQREQATQLLSAAQHSSETQIGELKSALAGANDRVAELSRRISDLQRDARDEKSLANEQQQSAAVAAAQMEADHAQLLRDCELLHAYQSETLQELQQLQVLYDQLLVERDEIETAAVAQSEEYERRLYELSKIAAAAESERAQLLQHLHLSQQENLQLHRQQQLDEREKNSLQSAVTSQNQVLQQEAAAKMQELQVGSTQILTLALLHVRFTV